MRFEWTCGLGRCIFAVSMRPECSRCVPPASEQRREGRVDRVRRGDPAFIAALERARDVHRQSSDKLPAWIECATEAADVRAQFIALALVTTAGVCHKHKRQGYGSREDDKRVLHGSQLWHSLVSPKPVLA